MTRGILVTAARWLYSAVALIGVIGVFPIAQKQFAGTGPCPTLGAVPACYLVLLGYSLIVVSAFVVANHRFKFFAAGWIPLLGLALTGTGLELLGQAACPRSMNGTPTCFLSLGLLALIATLYWAGRHFSRKWGSSGAEL